MTALADYKSQAKERRAFALEVYVAQSTSAPNPEPMRAVLAEHLAYQRELATAGALMFAGPVSDPTGAVMQGAGKIVHRAVSLEAARALADADPMRSSGAPSYDLSLVDQ